MERLEDMLIVKTYDESPCKFYKSFEKLEPDTFEGDKACWEFASGSFQGVHGACMEKRSEHFKKVCPWLARPDLEGEGE